MSNCQYVNSFKISLSESASESGVTREEFQQSIAATASVNTSYGAFSGHMEMAFSRQIAHSSEYMFAHKSFYSGENELQLNPGVALAYRGKDFLEAIEKLPATVDMENLHLFADFFGTFGTHYTRGVRLGASMEFYVAVSKTSTDNAKQVGVLMHAHYNGLFIKGSLSSELTNSQAWKSYISTSVIRVNVLGGSVEARGALSGIAEKEPSSTTVAAFDQWVASINGNTSGVNFRLAPIWELCGDKSSVVRQAWMQFGNIMHPQLSVNTWSPVIRAPLVELSGKGQIVPEVPSQYDFGCMVAILDRANLLGPDSVKFAKYYSVRPSTWPQTYLDMYNQVAKDIRASGFNNQNYALVFVTMGLDWNCVPSPDLAGLLFSAGAGPQLLNWINNATSGVQSNENVNYILVSFFNQGQSRGFEQLDHGKPYASVSSQLRVYFYRPSITGGLYTLGLSPFPTLTGSFPWVQPEQAGSYITHQSEKSAEEILEYWTPERMAEAEPVPFPPYPRTEPGEPGRGHAASQRGPDAQAYQTTMIKAPKIHLPPYRCAGKLFWTFGSRSFAGSAAVVDEKGLMTAAHNLYDHRTKQWADNIKFCPAFTANASNKYGSWTYREYAVPREWEAPDLSARIGYDVGLVKLNIGGNDWKPIGQVVGQLELVVNEPLNEDLQWFTLGYPARPITGYNFNGQEMWECQGNYIQKFEDENLVNKEGNLTGGSSGGPWLLKSGLIVSSFANGTQSAELPGEDENFTSYFTDWVMAFYKEYFGR